MDVHPSRALEFVHSPVYIEVEAKIRGDLSQRLLSTRSDDVERLSRLKRQIEALDELDKEIRKLAGI